MTTTYHLPLPDLFATPEDYLDTLLSMGATERYGSSADDADSAVQKRLRWEYDLICEKGWVNDFLVLNDLMREIRERDILISPGRGSSVDSIVCYCLGITDIDPLSYGLLSERFINTYTTSIQIDIDMEEGGLNELEDYLQEKFEETSARTPHRVHLHILELSRLSALHTRALQTNQNLKQIPLDNPATWNLFAQGDTLGVYLFEPENIRRYLRHLQPTSFEELMAVSALWWPSLMDQAESFLRRKHGIEPVTYVFPFLEEILGETRGLLLYQEQMMQIAQQVGGYSPDESDLLRRKLTHRNCPELQGLYRQFIERATYNGYPADKAEQCWFQYILPARHLINKAHIASCVMVSYYETYLKVHVLLH